MADISRVWSTHMVTSGVHLGQVSDVTITYLPSWTPYAPQ